MMQDLRKLKLSNDQGSECLHKPLNLVAKQQRKVRQHTTKPHYFTVFMTYINFLIVIVVAHIREFIYYLVNGRLPNTKIDTDKNRTAGILPAFSGFSAFFVRNIFLVGRACFNRPVANTPGTEIEVLERTRSSLFSAEFKVTGKKIKALNFGSYNYLGFAQNRGPCAEASKAEVQKNGVGMASPRSEVGTLELHQDLEKLVAEFLGKEDAVVFGMGFITNAGNLPAVLSKGTLLLSDELNHASIVLGAKLSGARVSTFNHNSMIDLENKLRRAIIEGQPKTHRPWKKIFVIVEGIYSMEGTVANIPALIALKHKYKFYIWLDEAHSIGAMGPTGRGVVEYWGCDTSHIDLMMGTFSKSFGAHGGYIASSAAVVSHIRARSHANYATAMTPGVAMQIYSSLRLIMGRDERFPGEGERRVRQLAENTRYFRSELYKRGFVVSGADDSPVIPVMLYYPGKTVLFSRFTLQSGIAACVVGFPAVALTEARARFCLSAGHTREMLDYCLSVLDEFNEAIGIAYFASNPIPAIPHHEDDKKED